MTIKQKTIRLSCCAGLVALSMACGQQVEPGDDAIGVRVPDAIAVRVPDAIDKVEPASPEIRDQFGQLVGDWDILQWRMDSAGAFPSEPLPARWAFQYALNGHAVQDFWIEPPPETPIPPGTQRQYGTNLRAYDAENGRWNIVWTSSDDPDLATYTARREGDELIMVGDHEGQRPSRIIYSDITEDSFQWRLEFQTEDGWLVVSRIEATRRVTL